MIFVRSCADAEEVAEKIGCSYYHREIGTTDEKEARLRDWMSGESGSPLLVQRPPEPESITLMSDGLCISKIRTD
jgi:hypothetical protein